MLKKFWKFCALSLALVIVVKAGMGAESEDRPNFLLVVFEDMSPHIGAYGDAQARTPVLDDFAAQSVLYEQVFTTAGVCSPSRAALLMGVHQQSIGAQQMRAQQGVTLPDGSRVPYTAVPPPQMKAYPELLRAAGYYTSNNGKTDYQLDLSITGGPFTIWDETNAGHPWRGRGDDRPFFAMVNLVQTHESRNFPLDLDPDSHPITPATLENLRRERAGRETGIEAGHDPATLELPPFLPDTAPVRAEYAQMLDNIFHTEQILARLLAELEEDGLAGNTIVIVTADHGDGLPRAKRSLYDSGLHVPLMVRWPDGRGAGTRNGELVSFVDIAPTVLDLAGVEVPEWMTGRIFLGERTGPERGYIQAAMDRHDEVPDYMRAVRDHRWKYIRNYRNDQPFFRHLAYRNMLRSMQELWRLEAAGELPPHIAQYFTGSRPEEELYDLRADPYELDNLAGDSDHAVQLDRMRSAMARFDARTPDWSADGELAMVERMWPDLERPETATPSFERLADGRVALYSATPGASIGYRIADGPWQLYTGPVELRPGQTLEAKAVRYGFTESQIKRVEG
ncbi:MAG: sulfatase-like hydrolase/transferase [Gammaproteobacteria bacterium]|nr:sulfatase-like hydrolase/transferase [Gammaproteobacteria bacterium]MXY89701.1 sulfatase-like hydrolase/transferase [Gammaproteobacteria bacterium]MXZ33498.1 sulfatase-like hydrolase/transferase [Gammaproteobacteria bacterium]MYC59087.1 sulfatase-like hydrolase/transferase [Gammaproteobacteria bacterium]MYE28277.1 sulfatase-like hydrolase/transferase [Gammaproteobacteria bacterium]